MKKEKVRRQHETTSIPELNGAVCGDFRVVVEPNDDWSGPAYLQLEGVWHRFYLDAGLLFWEEGTSPDPDDELIENERYSDFASKLGIRGATLTSVNMNECQLTLEFDNGARLVLRNEVLDEGSKLVEAIAASHR